MTIKSLLVQNFNCHNDFQTTCMGDKERREIVSSSKSPSIWFIRKGGGGGGGVGLKGYGFPALLAINRVWILTILLIKRVWFLCFGLELDMFLQEATLIPVHHAIRPSIKSPLQSL